MRSLRVLLFSLLIIVACTGERGGSRPATTEAAGEAAPINERASVTYTMDPKVVAAGEYPTGTVTNNGPERVSLGRGYRVEMRTPDGWEVVEQPANAEILCALTDELIVLEPTGSESEGISVCNRKGNDMIFEPGLYRVTKQVGVGGPTGEERKVTLRATFRVVAG